jgi:hypothetical protein
LHATHPKTTVRFRASNMQLYIESDVSYLSEPKARSRAAGHFYLGNHPQNPTIHNGPILNPTGILRQVVASAKAEFGGLFINGKEGTVCRNILADLGWTQGPTPIKTDNSTSDGIANDTIEQQWSKAMDMRFYWIRDRCKQGQFRVYWRPGAENCTDYNSKHHSAAHHRHIIHPQYLVNQASILSSLPSLRGCVDSQSHTRGPTTTGLGDNLQPPMTNTHLPSCTHWSRLRAYQPCIFHH